MQVSEARRPRVWRMSVSLTAIAATFVPRIAFAYCRTTTCDLNRSNPACSWDESGCAQAGIPLYWSPASVGYGAQENGSPKSNISEQDADAIWTAAFHTWLDADCGSAHPSFQAYDTGAIACDKAEFNKHGANANVLVFRDDSWPYATNSGGFSQTIAQTTVTANLLSGEILDADIEVNSFQVPLSTSNIHVSNDLQSILTHETGHFLGLAHSAVTGATMSAYYNSSTTMFRDLSADDQAAICNVYPPGANGTCTGPVITEGFSQFCDAGVAATTVQCTEKTKACACSMAEATRTARGGLPRGTGFLLVAAGFALRRSERSLLRERT